MTVRVGEQVWYSKYSGSEIKADQKDYVCVSEKDVLAVVDLA
jgi:chaperonin GroES